VIDGRLYHFGVVTHDIEDAMRHYTDVLGVGPFWRLDTNYQARFRGWEGTIANHNAFARWGDLLVEIVEPGIGNGPQKEALAARGEGVFHVGYSTPRPEQRPPGVEVCFEAIGSGIVYLDTIATLGYFVELVPEAVADSLIERVRTELGG
jgi:hypothetical protein